MTLESPSKLVIDPVQFYQPSIVCSSVMMQDIIVHLLISKTSVLNCMVQPTNVLEINIQSCLLCNFILCETIS